MATENKKKQRLFDLPETLGNALGLLAAFTDVTGSIATRSAKRKTPAIIF